MHCVSIMYPNPPGSAFNLQHYLAVHMPMGIGLLHQHFGIAPQRIEVLANGCGVDGAATAAPYHCVCNMHFDKREHVDRLIDLFGMEQPARLLKADWPKFTQADPVVLFSRCQDLDPADLIANAPRVIEAATRELGSA